MSPSKQPDPSSTLRISLLGNHEIIRAGQSLRVRHGKHLALLAYLALHPAPLLRNHLASMFWPELNEDNGRNNLRGVLHSLRNTLGSDALMSDRETIWLSPSARQGLDIDNFNAIVDQHSASAKTGSVQPKTEALSEAARLYRGELVSDLSLDLCDDFTDWLQLQRMTLHRRIISLLESLVQLYQQAGDTSHAITHAERLATLDPCNEQAHQQLIQLLATSGQTGSALRQYALMCHILDQELGVQPDEASLALYQQLKQQRPAAQQLAKTTDEADTVPNKAPPHTAFVTIAFLHSRQAKDMASPAQDLVEPPFRQRLEQHNAHVVNSHCGGVLAYFGYPAPLENSPQRSAKAVLELLQDPALASWQLGVGLHAGQMMTRFDDHHPDLGGQLTGTAIELGKQAEPGSVRVSQPLAQLLGQSYQLIPLLARRSADPVGYLLGSSMKRPTSQSRKGGLFGRQSQQQQLTALWQQVDKGDFTATLLKSPPGLGKSRLGEWCGEYARQRGGQMQIIHCHPQHQESSLYPVLNMLHQSCQLCSGGLETFSIEQLSTLLHKAKCLPPNHKATSQLAQVLGLESPDSTDPSQMAKYRHSSMQLLSTLVAAWAQQQPLLLLIEDVHWADHSTLEWLEQLLQLAPKRTMMLFTARPELRSERLNALPQVTIPALASDDALALLRQHSAKLAPDQLARVVAIAEGIPLFLEQLGSALQEGSLNHDKQLPESLKEVLIARLIKLGPAHRLLQIAATLGNTFNLRVLRTVAAFEHVTLFRSNLELLRELRLIDLQNSLQGRFLHNLIRTAAYESQSRAQTRQTHAQIARLWPLVDSSIEELHPEWLAEHHNSAGNLESALRYWHTAAQLEANAAAHTEAAAHFRRALATLDRLPPSSHLDGLQLALNFALGCSLIACQGYGSTEAREAFKYALQIAPTINDNQELFRPLFGLWLGGSSHGDYETSYHAALKLERLAQHSCEPTHRLQAAYALGNIHCWRGNFPESRMQLEKAIRLYHELQPTNLAADYGEDSGVTSQAFLSWIYWFIGEDEQANHAAKQSMDLADQIGHPFSQAFAYTFVARLYQLQGNSEAVNALAGRLQTLAKRYDFPIWQAAGSLLQGWAIGVMGDDHGIEMAEQGLKLVHEAMPSVEVTFLTILADLHFKRGHDRIARIYAEQALDKGSALTDHYMQAEMTRLCGLIQHRNGEPGAELLLGKAVQIATAQGASRIALTAQNDLLAIRR